MSIYQKTIYLKVNLYNMEFLDDDRKKKLTNFFKFVRNHLGIKTPPPIIIQNGRKGLKTTASYDYTKPGNPIRINGKGRALVDIMRSGAHEMVHHKQWEDGKLKVRPPDIGGPIEDEANAVAGQLIKLFALKDSTIYEGINNRKTIKETNWYD